MLTPAVHGATFHGPRFFTSTFLSSHGSHCQCAKLLLQQDNAESLVPIDFPSTCESLHPICSSSEHVYDVSIDVLTPGGACSNFQRSKVFHIHIYKFTLFNLRSRARRSRRSAFAHSAKFTHTHTLWHLTHYKWNRSQRSFMIYNPEMKMSNWYENNLRAWESEVPRWEDFATSRRGQGTDMPTRSSECCRASTTRVFTIGFFWVFFFKKKTQSSEVQQNMVLFGFIQIFCIKTKNPMHYPEKVGVFPPLMIIAGWNTHGSS